MKFFQIPNTISLEPILSISQNTFAEIIDETNDSFIFNLSVTISLNNNSKKIEYFDRIEATVFENNSIPLSKKNIKKSPTRQDDALNKLKYSPAVLNKIKSNTDLVKSYKKENKFLALEKHSLASYNSDLNKNFYHTRAITPLNENLKNSNLESFNFNPLDLIHDTNKNQVDPTSVLDILEYKNCSDLTLKKKKIKNDQITDYYYNIAKYLLKDIQDPTENSNIEKYQILNKVEKLNFIPINFNIKIGKNYRNSILDIKFDLYRAKTNTVEESYIFKINMKQYVEAFLSTYNPPEISIFHHNKNQYTLTIVDKEISGGISGFNIYEKSIGEMANVGNYKFVDYITNKNINTFNGITNNNLSVLRVVPVNREGKETNNFTNKVIGNYYNNFGKLTIVVWNNNEGIHIDTFGIPVNCKKIDFFARNCQDSNSYFNNIKTLLLGENESKLTVTWKGETDKIYEFYAVCYCFNDNVDQNKIFSNFVLFNNRIISNDTISVDIFNSFQNQKEVNFDIKTIVGIKESENITRLIKEQIPELYSQYLDPSNNLSSPLTGEYADLFLHEVVRTNLNTGEREVFNLVSDGTFKDNSETRTLSNIKDIDPEMEYIYQIFSFRKNPLELFKKFVLQGKTSSGAEWFYHPYKWLNSNVKKSGVLYPCDNEGMPIISDYDNYTSTAYGLTGTYKVLGTSSYTSLIDANLERIDRKTIKITWNIKNKDDLKLYDSFMVMKSVNGIRSFLGRSCKNYIYHDLKEDDLGSIYYIIVPIMKEFDIGKPFYTDSTLVTAEGIVKTTKSLLRQIR